jgi:heme oxygenase (biliverdin-IX-beta and delta-forming)
MILERLKTETRPYHDRIEEVGFSTQIMSGQLTLEEYKMLVINNYRIHKLVEDTLEQNPQVKNLEGLEFDNRKKTAMLAKDLESLGLNPADYTTDDITLDLSDFHTAMGVYYVLEGSTLGGSVIARQLAKNEQIAAAGVTEFNFYGCYGDMVGPRWKAFQQVLINVATDTAAEDKMVAGASAAFNAMTEMFITARGLAK